MKKNPNAGIAVILVIAAAAICGIVMLAKMEKTFATKLPEQEVEIVNVEESKSEMEAEAGIEMETETADAKERVISSA